MKERRAELSLRMDTRFLSIGHTSDRRHRHRSVQLVAVNTIATNRTRERASMSSSRSRLHSYTFTGSRLAREHDRECAGSPAFPNPQDKVLEGPCHALHPATLTRTLMFSLRSTIKIPCLRDFGSNCVFIPEVTGMPGTEQSIGRSRRSNPGVWHEEIRMPSRCSRMLATPIVCSGTGR